MNNLVITLTALDPLHLIYLIGCAAVLHDGCNRRAVRLIEATRKR
jgi:hypothetical protein